MQGYVLLKWAFPQPLRSESMPCTYKTSHSQKLKWQKAFVYKVLMAFTQGLDWVLDT